MSECCEGHGCCHEEEGTAWQWQVLSLAMLVAGIVGDACQWLIFSGWVPAVWFLLAFLPVAVPVMREAWESLREKDVFNEFTLMLVASIGAFAIGEYPEAVAVMLFYSIGESLQDRAVDRARDNIKALVAVRPERAMVVDGDRLVERKPSEVEVGTLIEIKTGERVPLDGLLQGECAAFDTSALTGESVPRTVEDGGEVLAGMIAADRVVRLKVTRTEADSALSRIMRLVDDAAERKAPMELFIRKFARIYTPVVTLLAVLIVAVPWIVSLFGAFDYTISDWLYRGLVFLVISCPCALVVSIPLGYFGGIGAASRLGILFKGGNYLDAMAKVKAVAFDKTGTLTKGEFQVVSITADGVSEDTLLQAVASAESGSNHPIAKAIAEAAKQRNVTTIAPAAVEELAGYGLKAIVDGSQVLAGNLRLLEKEGIAYPDSLKEVVDTMVCCAIGRRYAGCLCLADVAKDDAQEAMRRLKSEGVEHLAVLSGDRSAIVDRFASEVGIDEAFGDLLPADKVRKFEEFKNAHSGVVAYVGDGINDAPVLALSDVGIAMGGLGSDAAVETADVVIETDQPSRIADAVRVGKATRRIVTQNIVLALGVKVVVMLLGALGFANLWAAVFADVGVAMIAIVNALRVGRVVKR